MSDQNGVWDLYWEVRLQGMETLGKRDAILAVSKLIRRLSAQSPQPVRLLELGCGEGQIIGTLVEGHAQVRGIDGSTGVDYLPSSIKTCRSRYPMMRFIEGDFTDPALLESLEPFEIVILVNALHEVFSAAYSSELGQVDVPAAKQRVRQALAGAAARISPGGFLVLFDGLEMSGDIHQKIRIRFLSRQARERFDIFAREYHPFNISYVETGSPFSIELSRRDFTRYITKSIFLGKHLWQSERFESYQYFNEPEFREAVARSGLEIREMLTLTVNDEKWNNTVEIETPGADFPTEHILIIAQKPG